MVVQLINTTQMLVYLTKELNINKSYIFDS